jgi:hypothetical protein
VAYFTRAIPPGGKGKITLRVNTRGYRGEIRKRARVYTNDPRKSIEVLNIRAFVKVPIYISSRYVYISGLAGQKITRTVSVRAEENKPLKLEPSYFDLGKRLTYRIEEVKLGRIFKIHFTSIPGPVGTFRGILKLKTNYPEKPQIAIRVRAQFKKGARTKNRGKN